MGRVTLVLALLVLSISPLAAQPANGSPAGATAAVALPPRKDLPGIETFMQIGAASNPTLTRDGRTLFFTSSMTGTSQLYRLTPEGWPYQLTFFPNGVSGYNLSNDGRAIAVTAAPGGTELYQIFLLDAVTGLTRQLTKDEKARFGVPLFAPDDRKIYFSGNPDSPTDFTIYEQDLSTGSRRVVYRQGRTERARRSDR